MKNRQSETKPAMRRPCSLYLKDTSRMQLCAKYKMYYRWKQPSS